MLNLQKFLINAPIQERIQNLIQQKVKEKSKEIILAYYQLLINKHNEFCGCNYCLKLKEYVNLKKKNHRFLKIYDGQIELGDLEWSINLERKYFDDYIIINNKIKQLKIDKDKLKQLN